MSILSASRRILKRGSLTSPITLQNDKNYSKNNNNNNKINSSYRIAKPGPGNGCLQTDSSSNNNI